jgi:hypothetical protein
MIDGSSTIDELRSHHLGTPQEAWINMFLAQTHEGRVKAVQKAVDFCCNELEQTKNSDGVMSEDQISQRICGMLKMAGFQASHDKSTNGHPDIVVDGIDSFLWLGEAKKHSDYAWLNKGFQQLSTRYSTGVIGQDNGDVLIYCYTKNAKAMLDEWRKTLCAKNAGVIDTNSPCGNPLIFCSTHKHEATGLDFHVRHKAVALYWDPKDK